LEVELEKQVETYISSADLKTIFKPNILNELDKQFEKFTKTFDFFNQVKDEKLL
jgi:hypothetical protein